MEYSSALPYDVNAVALGAVEFVQAFAAHPQGVSYPLRLQGGLF